VAELDKPGFVINEHVELAKSCKMDRVVNGVLRNIVRDRDSDSLPLPAVRTLKVPKILDLFQITDEDIDEAELVTRLSIVYSHPEWMIQRWMGFRGMEDTLSLMRHNNS